MRIDQKHSENVPQTHFKPHLIIFEDLGCIIEIFIHPIVSSAFALIGWVDWQTHNDQFFTSILYQQIWYQINVEASNKKD